LFDHSRYKLSSAKLDGSYINVNRRGRLDAETSNNKSIELIVEEEISQEHILGPQGKITYILKKY
jgi:hypothetical protein